MPPRKRQKQPGKLPGGQLVGVDECPRCRKETLVIKTTQFGGPDFNKLHCYCPKPTPANPKAEGCGFRGNLSLEDSISTFKAWEAACHEIQHPANVDAEPPAGAIDDEPDPETADTGESAGLPTEGGGRGISFPWLE